MIILYQMYIRELNKFLKCTTLENRQEKLVFQLIVMWKSDILFSISVRRFFLQMIWKFDALQIRYDEEIVSRYEYCTERRTQAISLVNNFREFIIYMFVESSQSRRGQSLMQVKLDSVYKLQCASECSK